MRNKFRITFFIALGLVFIGFQTKQADAAVALRQVASTSANFDVTNLSLAFPQNSTSGDVIAIGAWTDSTFIHATSSCTTGNFTVLSSGSTGNATATAAYGIVNASGPCTVTITQATATTLEFVMSEIGGVDNGNPIDVVTSTISGFTNSFTSGTTTPVFSGDYIDAIGMDLNGSGLVGSVGNGYTPEVNDQTVYVGDYIQEVAAPISATFSVTGGSTTYFTTLVAFKAAPDTTPPSVTLVSPVSGSTVFSNITLSASSTDNVAVAGVQFQIDGVNLGPEVTTTSSPSLYSTIWNTASSSNGTHIISAIAYDTSNNSSTATSSVTVDNVQPSPPSSTPTISIGVPASYGTSGYNLIPGSTIPEKSTTTQAPTTTPPLSTSSLEAEIASLQAELESLFAESPKSSFEFTKNLSFGMQGSDVQALQSFLIEQNSGPSAEKLKAHGTTEYFGILTFNALKEYQASIGLPATGYFGEMTRGRVCVMPSCF